MARWATWVVLGTVGLALTRRQRGARGLKPRSRHRFVYRRWQLENDQPRNGKQMLARLGLALESSYRLAQLSSYRATSGDGGGQAGWSRWSSKRRLCRKQRLNKCWTAPTRAREPMSQPANPAIQHEPAALSRPFPALGWVWPGLVAGSP